MGVDKQARAMVSCSYPKQQPVRGLNKEDKVKLYVSTEGKQATVSLEPEPKKDQNGNQRSERNTGRPMWSTQVFVLDETGGEVITITTAGEKPNVKVGQLVVPVQ